MFFLTFTFERFNAFERCGRMQILNYVGSDYLISTGTVLYHLAI